MLDTWLRDLRGSARGREMDTWLQDIRARGRGKGAGPTWLKDMRGRARGYGTGYVVVGYGTQGNLSNWVTLFHLEKKCIYSLPYRRYLVRIPSYIIFRKRSCELMSNVTVY